MCTRRRVWRGSRGDIDYGRLFARRAVLTVDGDIAERAMGPDWRKRLVAEASRLGPAAAALTENIDRLARRVRGAPTTSPSARRRTPERGARLVDAAETWPAILPFPESWFADGAVAWRIELTAREAESELPCCGTPRRRWVGSSTHR